VWVDQVGFCRRWGGVVRGYQNIPPNSKGSAPACSAVICRGASRLTPRLETGRPRPCGLWGFFPSSREKLDQTCCPETILRFGPFYQGGATKDKVMEQAGCPPKPLSALTFWDPKNCESPW
jgi:hypothetical protein